MSPKTFFTYRLACRYEAAPSTETEMPDQQTAIREAWKAAGNPYVTSVRVLRAVRGSPLFKTAHNLKG